MLNVKQLQRHIDSLKVKTTRDFGKRVDREIGVNFAFGRWGDTGWKKLPPVPMPNVKTYEKLIPDSIRDIVMNKALEKINLAREFHGRIDERIPATKKGLAGSPD